MQAQLSSGKFSIIIWYICRKLEKQRQKVVKKKLKELNRKRNYKSLYPSEAKFEKSKFMEAVLKFDKLEKLKSSPPKPKKIQLTPIEIK